MPEKLTVNVPHKLGREDARQRIDNGFAKIQEQVAGNTIDVSQNWDGDVMFFRGSGMGQSITGQLTVNDDNVMIEVDLPWLLAKISGTVKEKLVSTTSLLLEKK